MVVRVRDSNDGSFVEEVAELEGQRARSEAWITAEDVTERRVPEEGDVSKDKQRPLPPEAT